MHFLIRKDSNMTEDNSKRRVSEAHSLLDDLDPARIQVLAAMPYPDYLKTPEWQYRRSEALVRVAYRCQICNTPDHLNVHHRDYERRGNERPEDLTVLCGSCHQLYHDKLPAPPSPFNW